MSIGPQTRHSSLRARAGGAGRRARRRGVRRTSCELDVEPLGQRRRLASPGGGGTVTLWHGYTDVERTATDAFVAKFNATNPGFTVKSVFAGNNDYALQKLLTALAAGKAPDISYQYGSSMANLATSPKIVDLGPHHGRRPPTSTGTTSTRRNAWRRR